MLSSLGGGGGWGVWMRFDLDIVAELVVKHHLSHSNHRDEWAKILLLVHANRYSLKTVTSLKTLFFAGLPARLIVCQTVRL